MTRCNSFRYYLFGPSYYVAVHKITPPVSVWERYIPPIMIIIVIETASNGLIAILNRVEWMDFTSRLQNLVTTRWITPSPNVLAKWEVFQSCTFGDQSKAHLCNLKLDFFL